MKKISYQKINEDLKLTQRIDIDEKGRVVSIKDFKSKPPIENRYKYNDSDLIIEEIEFDINNNSEISKQEINYNSKNEIIEDNFYINGELFENTVFEYQDSMIIKTTYQEDVAVQKQIKEVNSNGNFKSTFYEYDNLVQIQTYEKNTVNKSSKMVYYEPDNSLIVVIFEYFDGYNNLIKHVERDDKDDLLLETIYNYDHKLLLNESVKNYINGQNEYKILYEYDRNENWIKMETKTLNDILLSSHLREFDTNNRVIEERIIEANGSSNREIGLNSGMNAIHIVHKYNEN